MASQLSGASQLILRALNAVKGFHRFQGQGVAYLIPPTLMTTGWSAGPVGGSKPSDFSAQEEGREVSWASGTAIVTVTLVTVTVVNVEVTTVTVVTVEVVTVTVVTVEVVTVSVVTVTVVTVVTETVVTEAVVTMHMRDHGCSSMDTGTLFGKAEGVEW